MKPIDPQLLSQAETQYVQGDESLVAIARTFGISERKIEDYAKENHWVAKRSAHKLGQTFVPPEPKPIASNVTPFKKKKRCQGEERIDRPTPRTETGAIDSLQIVELAIADLSGGMPGAEIKSREAAATALIKLLEYRDSLTTPRTAEAIADLCFENNISPQDFIRALDLRWRDADSA